MRQANVYQYVNGTKSVIATECLKVLQQGLFSNIEILFSDDTSQILTFHEDTMPIHKAKVLKNWVWPHSTTLIILAFTEGLSQLE